VLGQENAGSSQIIAVGVQIATEGAEEDAFTVELLFSNPELDQDAVGLNSVHYLIQGSSRDWVFVTSSVLEERVTKIRRRWRLRSLSRNTEGVIFAGFLMTMTITVIKLLVSVAKSQVTSGDLLGKAIADGTVKTPLDALVVLQKAHESAQVTLLDLGGAIITGLAVGLLWFLACGFVKRYYPLYNFCWGDYVSEFERKESIRKNVLVVVVIGLVISITGSVIANFIRH
jgi:hypothetical protein